MENWQLTLIILASVFVGASIPLLVKLGITIHRAGIEIAEIGTQMKRTMVHVEIISERVEVLSRGFKGGEMDIADLLKTVGHVAQGLERNMKTVNMLSAIVTTVGSAVGAFVKARFPAEETGNPSIPEVVGVPGNGAPLSPMAASASSTIEEV
jgi:hypothetical protein